MVLDLLVVWASGSKILSGLAVRVAQSNQSEIPRIPKSETEDLLDSRLKVNKLIDCFASKDFSVALR